MRRIPEEEQMKVFAKTDIGRVRPLNEDSLYLPQGNENFCAVADGMGGHNAGEVASAMAVEVFAREMRACTVPDGNALKRAVERANREVYAESCRAEGCSGMGTTFTALGLHAGRAAIAHVGDSRAYLIRGGEILRLTVDHTYVEELVMQGIITPQEAKYHPKRNYITRALGTAPRVEVDLMEVELQAGDVYLLCSDGLTGYIEDPELLAVSCGEGSWTEKIEELVGRALRAGGSDNITCMYAVFEEDQK